MCLCAKPKVRPPHITSKTVRGSESKMQTEGPSKGVSSNYFYPKRHCDVNL